jgi:hypothetical protein
VSRALPDPGRVAETYLREAIAEARLAYSYVPSSYTYSCLSACLAAEQAVAALRAALLAHTDGEGT